MSDVPRGLSRLSKAILITASFLAPVALSEPLAAQTSPKPNILFIMGDDIGWFNIGAYHRGMTAGQTPNLDLHECM